MLEPDETWDVVTGVGLTALAAAACRAIDSSRPDGLADDPHAEALVRAADPPKHMPTRDDELGDSDEDTTWRYISRHTGVRTRFFDEVLIAASAAGVRQVVLLAAGLDCRAYRMVWPEGSVVYEVDQPEVLRFKTDVLAAHGVEAGCERREIGIDLRGDWPGALRAMGFDPALPTAWLAEGLLAYLATDVVRVLLDDINVLSAPWSHFATEEFPAGGGDDVVRSSAGRLAASTGAATSDLFKTDSRVSPAEWLRDRGWQVTSVLAPDEATRRGRPELAEIGDRLGMAPKELITAVFPDRGSGAPAIR